MNHDEIKHLIDTSPAVSLLRKQVAPLIISFLYQEFKLKHRYAVPRSELVERLDWFLFALREQEKSDYRNTAEAYLDQWAADGILYVRLSTEAADYVVQLTPEGERVIAWFEDMTRQSFIATESRLLTIYTLLEDVVNKSEQDIETRLKRLEKQKDEIEEEITRIRQTGEIEIYSSVRLRGRLQQIEELSRQLLRDFAFIEERFRQLAQQILEEQIHPEARKGTILGSVLDAHEALRLTEEGQSFYAFRDFLANDDQKDSLQKLLEEVAAPEFSEVTQENLFLRRLVKHLADAGDRIDASNRRLAQNLRYLLDEHIMTENQRVRTLISEIKQIAYSTSEEVGPNEIILEIEGPPIISLIMERPLYEPQDNQAVIGIPINAILSWDANALIKMFGTFFVDESILRDRINKMLELHTEVTLADIVSYYPIEKGVSELMSYISLAARISQHSIEEAQKEQIIVSYFEGEDQYSTEFIIPRVTFRRPGLE